MKRLILLTTLCLGIGCAGASDTGVVMGQRNGMMFTDLVPDYYYWCSWQNGARTCNKYFYHDVNRDGVDDFYLVFVNVECNFGSFQRWELYSITNIEFVIDTLGILPFDEDDTVKAGTNVETDHRYTVTGYDSTGNEIYGNVPLVRTGHWVDTAHRAYGTCLVNHLGGGAVGCSHDLNWETSLPDTNYFPFRLIANGDTAYGWVKTRVYMLDITCESFAIAADSTSSHIYNAVVELPALPQVKVFPNPATDRLTINLGNLQAEQVSVYNLQGALINQINQPADNSIDITALPNGIYLAEVKLQGKVQRVRWVKMSN